jgi:uncharacterized iron-regulated membrane protein
MKKQLSSHRRGALQRLWRNIHLWLGVGLFILLVPVALSGAILVYHDAIDEMIQTPRSATPAGKQPDLALAVANAKAAAGDKFQPNAIRFPDGARAPMTVQLRGPAAKQGERPVFLTAYVDRNDPRVLNVVNSRDTFFGFMHVFHENLTIPFWYGRDIVGWTGVAMLILSLTGLYLWWPRAGQWSRAFAWRRAPATSSNLHYLTGFWICFPLAFVSLTGIYLAWPQQGRAVVSSMAQMSPQQQRGGAQLIANPQRSPNDILSIAAALPNSEVDAIFYPTAQSGAWRVQLNESGRTEPVTVLIDDRSGAITKAEALTGDRIGLWIRRLHEGSDAGGIWRFVVFVSGIAPALLGVTGILVWLRQRRQRALMTAGDQKTSPAGSLGTTSPAE